jgi:predicted nucleotide-binding protein (sugar kinase/HSP70/actin superfamily)
MKVIGIPRAMSYYYLYPFFKTLFERLDVELLLSKPTTKTTLTKISACPTDEPCLAVKLYFAHVQELVESNCDYIFLPKVISVEKNNYCCPKFIGIPEMIRNTFVLDQRGLFPRIDFNHPQNMMNDLSQMIAKLSPTTKRIPQIFKSAWKFQEEFAKLPVLEELTIVEAYRNLNDHYSHTHTQNKIDIKREKLTIGLIGHPYVLYEWISHNLVQHLRSYGKVITPEMIDRQFIKKHLKNIYEGHQLWNFEAQMLGAALYLIENRIVKKLILVGLFECGPESIIEPYIEEASEKFGVSLLKLFMDDQTGEAGLQTRIEAFMDTDTQALVFDKSPSTNASVSFEKPTEPVVGFPSMGHLDIVMNTILKDCNIKTIPTPKLNRNSIELGKELAPEYICLPLAATLGQIIQMLDLGVNRILMVGGKGPCRFGWYAQVQELLLKKTGRSFEMIILDSPFPLQKKGFQFMHDVAKITSNARWDKIVKSFIFGYRKLKTLNQMEISCHNLSAYESVRGTADRLFTRFLTRLYNVDSYQNLNTIEKEFFEAVHNTAVENTNPVKILIVGEIWVILEPFINLEIDKYLSSRPDVRVLVEREMNMSLWVQHNIFHTAEMKKRWQEIQAAAAPFMNEHIGGHALESVAGAVIGKQKGIDGVIHLFPFTCMPEIVAQGILTKVSDNLDIPILSLIISEQTGEAGMRTRIEAFLDLLVERRFDKEEGNYRAKLCRH